MKTLAISSMLLVAICPVSFAGETGEETKAAVDMEAMMAEYMKYAQPGEHHGHLAPLAGQWELAGRYRHDASMPWEESTSTCHTEWILGDRFLMSEVQGEATETMQAFEGVGIVGYDVYKQKYVSLWADNFGTMVFVQEGTCDGSGKAITFRGSYDDPVTGKTETSRSVYTIENNDKYVLDMYKIQPDGSEVHNMSIVHTRVTASAAGD